MPNKALQELQGLIDIGADAQAQAAGAKAFVDSRRSFDRVPGEDDEAEFALPEAAVTAVGAGWLLGPVGGVLMGVAQGILGQREKQNAIDAYAHDTQILNQTSDAFSDEVTRQAAGADAPEDIEQLSALLTQKDEAVRLMGAADPGMQEQGSALLADAYKQLTAFGLTQERQRIEADSLLDSQTRTVFSDLKSDFRVDSAGFEERLQQADNVIEALNRGDGASLTAALSAMPLIVNPEAGAVTDAEVKAWQKINGTVDSLLGRIDKEFGLGGLTDDTVLQIREVARQYKRNNITWQQAREAKYGELLQTENIPQRLWGYFNKTQHVPGLQGKGFVRRDSAKPAIKSAVATAVGAAEGVRDTVSGAHQSVDSAVKGLGDSLLERSRDPRFKNK